MRNITILVMLFFTQAIWAGCYNETESNENNFKNCQAEAEKGDADAQYELANIYNSGQIGDKDPEKAVFWYRKSAEQDNDLAQYSLGVMSEFGMGGLAQSEQDAKKWYQLAADNGNYFAQNKLGLIQPQKGKHESSVTVYHDDSEELLEQKKDKNIIGQIYDWVLDIIN